MRGRIRGHVRAGLLAGFAAVAGAALAEDPPGPAQPAPAGRTLHVPIDGEIDLGLAPFVERLLADAHEGDTVIFEINTFGGRIDAAVVIRDAILDTKATTVAFVNKRAISAGALIALATDTIVMSNGATIGAATPVQLEGGPGEQKMAPVEAKVVSYMRKEMKSTAEAKNRRGDIAEAMVDARVEIAGLDGKETTLTLTTAEALKYDYAAFSVESVPELCKKLGRAEPDRLRPELNWAERLARFLSQPAIASLLMTLGMLGILIELWHPGHAVAGILGVVCLVLFFFGHYVVHLAGWGEIVLFALGLTAVVIEVFFWPGHGALAVLGVLAIVAALALALLDAKTVPFSVSWSLGWVPRALTRVFGSVLLTGALMVVVTRFLPKTRFGRPLVLETAITARAGAGDAQASPGLPNETLLGARGVAETPLRPAGKVRVAGRQLDVVTEGDFLERGTAIEVAAVEGARIVVRRAPA